MKKIYKNQNQNQIKSIVIGGGFGGIAIALRLKSLGHQVTLLERLSSLGGRAQVFKKNGFKIINEKNCRVGHWVYSVPAIEKNQIKEDQEV